MKIYHLIGRLSSPFQLSFFFLYNRIFHVPRARVMIWNEHGELLLVRNWGGKQQWGLPGGGVEKNEQPVAAARRELFEEIGIELSTGELTHVTTINYQYEAVIYAAAIAKNALPTQPHNPWEITDLQWFSPQDLPSDLSPLIPAALKELSKEE